MPKPKPFLHYKLPGGVLIVPQTALGWLIFACMMAVILIPVAAQTWIAPRATNFMIVYFITMPVVLIGFVVIAVRNADVIDLRSDAADLADFRAWQAERRRGEKRK